jgi:large subunit ribosomal protein L13
MRTTFMAKTNQVERKWLLIDAEGKTLGRLASEAAALIRGKHKPTFTPHINMGDFVVVINADKINLTGKKLLQKKYYTHSHYPGGLKTTTAGEMLQKRPGRLIELAVYGMLPHNKLGHQLQTHLKVYAGAEHPHQAQQPEVYELRG